MFISMFENMISRKMENPYANILHLSLFNFFEILYCFSFKETSCYLISSCQIISKAII